MKTLTATFIAASSLLSTVRPYFRLAGMGMALLAAACGEASAFEAVQEVDGLVYAEDIEFADEIALEAVGVQEPGDIWVDDCNVCMLTEDGTACTRRLCEEYDPNEVAADAALSCEDGEYADGDIWMESCNMCMCADGESVCTLKECDPDSLPH